MPSWRYITHLLLALLAFRRISFRKTFPLQYGVGHDRAYFSLSPVLLNTFTAKKRLVLKAIASRKLTRLLITHAQQAYCISRALFQIFEYCQPTELLLNPARDSRLSSAEACR